jgi:hypothetical protein
MKERIENIQACIENAVHVASELSLPSVKEEAQAAFGGPSRATLLKDISIVGLDRALDNCTKWFFSRNLQAYIQEKKLSIEDLTQQLSYIESYELSDECKCRWCEACKLRIED